MRYIISGKNLDITEGLRSAVTDKLGKLERYFTPDTEVIVAGEGSKSLSKGVWCIRDKRCNRTGTVLGIIHLLV